MRAALLREVSSMRRFIAVLVAASLLAMPAAANAAGGGKAKKGPKGIPFSCSDARTLRVVYENGGTPRAKAKLQFDGGEKYDLAYAPTELGRRYAKEIEGRTVSWSTDGVEAVLGEGEREVARCRRAGRDGQPVSHGAEHKDGAH
jgi:hypothetical protein